MKKGSPEGYNAETGLVEPAQKPQTGEPHERQPLYRIRCAQENNYRVKMADGQIVKEGRLRATHDALRRWAGRRPEPWRGAMEATLFRGWIYDTLKPFFPAGPSLWTAESKKSFPRGNRFWKFVVYKENRAKNRRRFRCRKT
jgi:hypothetical protein